VPFNLGFISEFVRGLTDILERNVTPPQVANSIQFTLLLLRSFRHLLIFYEDYTNFNWIAINY